MLIQGGMMTSGRRFTVPYDFDYGGLVNAPYAVVDATRIRGITTVRERLYLGPCRTEAELEPHFAKFRAAKNDIVVLLNSDMRVERDFLAPLLEGFSDEKVFSVACQIFFSDPNKPAPSAG